MVEKSRRLFRWLFGTYADGVEMSELAALLMASDAFARRKPRLMRQGAKTQRINWVRETLKRPVYKGVLNELRTDHVDVLGDWEAGLFQRICSLTPRTDSQENKGSGESGD